jgi:tetratricopeptide (TPR) repeat protein
MQLGQAYANAGNIKEAIAALKDAEQSDPNNLMYGEQIAEVYVRANQLDEAIKQYETLKAKATEDWRKTNYSNRIEQLKLQKQQSQGKPASPTTVTTPAATSVLPTPTIATTAPTTTPTVSAPAPAEKKKRR